MPSDHGGHGIGDRGCHLRRRLPSAALLAGVRTVPLVAGLTMLPVTGALAAELGQAAGEEPIRPGWVLRQRIAGLARQISVGGRALYVFGETFGGEGTQEAIGWQDGRLLFGPAGTCDIEAGLDPGHHVVPPRKSAINAGLRALGVHAEAGQDEYETAGLTRHRFTEDWLTESPP